MSTFLNLFRILYKMEMGTSVIFSYLVNGKEDVLKERKKGTSYNPLSSRNR